MVQTKEEKNEYQRLYRLKNKEKSKEQGRLYYLENKEEMKEKKRLYYLKNQEEIKEKKRLYYLENKEKKRLYYLNNEEKIKEYQKEYFQTSSGIKANTISNWKRNGVKDHFNDNYDTLYRIYQSTKFCDDCGFQLNIEGDYRTKKCLDHEHVSGYFRNILCMSCNIKRG